MATNPGSALVVLIRSLSAEQAIKAIKASPFVGVAFQSAPPVRILESQFDALGYPCVHAPS